MSLYSPEVSAHDSDEAEPAYLGSLPVPQLSREVLASIVELHGLPVLIDDVRPLAATGVVNGIWALGTEFVLRVPKAHLGAVRDTLTEAVAAPAAHATGVRTPRLVAFDNSRSLLDVPFTIYERVPGAGITSVGADAGDLASVWRDLGRDLAIVHERGTCEDPNGWLDEPERALEYEGVVEDCVSHGHINADNAATLRCMLKPLHESVAWAASLKHLIHNDVQPANVMADRGRYTGLIDWGDAGFGDPAIDFQVLPLRAVKYALEGYREVRTLDDGAEARIWYDHLVGALFCLDGGPNLDAVSWARPPAARLIEIVATLDRGEIGRIP